MALQFSVAIRNAQANAIESTIGASAVLKIRTGPPPANVAAADAGSVLATLNLPADWMGAASGGAVGKSGTWEDTSADDTGTSAHFRVYASDGTTCHIQGTVGMADADMLVDNDNFAAGQPFTITAFGITMGNA